MKKFIKNTKGAVTVFVTLLLIPAMLISGTAVDLTRIYTARSIVQDANQLAANAVLTQYNALLHDLYGVFGIAENDPILAKLLDEYISITVFGEEGHDTSMVTLQLFYGSNLSLDEVYFASGKNLRNPDVLRRQIEEYMKFRGPVIIVKEIFELIGSNTFKEDTKVIDEKLKIDETISEIYDKYKELYEAINAADICDKVPSNTAGALGDVSNYIQNNIYKEFKNLKDCMEEWEEEEDSDVKSDLEKKYYAILDNFDAWISGGKKGNNWKNGKWSSTSTVIGLEKSIENALVRADRHKELFDKVVSIAKQVDAMKDDLARQIEKLEELLEKGECNEELRAALTKRDPETGKSVIEMYKDILKWEDIEGMSKVYSESGYKYIDEPVKDTIKSVIYRNKYSSISPKLTRDEVKDAASLSSLALSAGNSMVIGLVYSGVEPVTYGMPEGFLKFAEHPGNNKPFFDDLTDMMKQGNLPPVTLYDEQEESEGEGTKEKQENLIDELLGLVDAAYAGLTNNPLGAKYISGAASDDDDAEDASNITKAVSDSVSNSFTDVISDPEGVIAKAGNYLLLLTYCTSMFSNYTTARPEINGKTIDETGGIEFPVSISGVPISPKVNYFFQSEWEYLYNGKEDAGKNLSAISRLIYLVRVICNYITVFSVAEVNNVVGMIRTSFAWSPPLALVLGELARAAFVAAESAIDVATLRSGYKVPLIKTSKQWICSPKGLARALGDILSDTVKKDDKDDDKDGKGLTYSHYMLFFFLAKGLVSSDMASQLTDRTADLLEWNVINYKNGVQCDEDKMSQALGADGRFKLENMITDFSVTTTVDMRMLFLSMVFAQNYAGSKGIGMPQTMPVSVTDYRGY